MKKIIKTIWENFRKHIPIMLLIIIILIALGIVNWLSKKNNSSIPEKQAEETKKVYEKEEIFYFDVDGDGLEEKILRESSSWNWRYSFFKDEKSLGTIDFNMQKHDLIPEFRIVNNGKDKTWFIIKSLAGTGTGLILFEEQWYKISDKGIKNVLEYPAYGHISSGVGMGDRAIKSEIISEMPINDAYTINIEFEASYATEFHREDSKKVECEGFYDSEEYIDCLFELFKKDSNLFTINKKARYAWDKDDEIFKIDILNSELAQRQIDGLWNDGGNDFLKHNFKELLELARTGTDIQKKWIELLLEGCGDSWEESNLLALLSENEPYIGKEVVYYGVLFRWSTSGELRFGYYDTEKAQAIDDSYYWFFAFLPNSESANDTESYQEIILPYLNFLTEENQGAVFKITGLRMMNEDKYYSECENCGTPDPLHQIEIDKIEVYKESYNTP